VPETLFFRMLKETEKGPALGKAIGALSSGGSGDNTYPVEPSSFSQVPGSPFAYWVSERIRRLFLELPPFESGGRTVKQGLATADDFRFVRAWWEVAPERILDSQKGPDWREDLETFQSWCRQRTFEGKRWVPFAKGGEYSPYYADIHLVVNWERDGEEIRNFVDPKTGKTLSRPQNTDYYFRPGLTWPRRTQGGLSFRPYNAGGIFADKGPAAFVDLAASAIFLGVINSRGFYILITLQMAFGSYEVGVIQRTPVPDVSAQVGHRLGETARSAVKLKRSLDTANETSHVFQLPALLQGNGQTLAEGIGSSQAKEAAAVEKLAEYQREIDDIAFRLYGIDGEDRRVIEQGAHREGVGAEEDSEKEESKE